MTVYTHVTPETPTGFPGHIVTRASEGLDRAEIRLVYSGGTRKALLLLARASLDLIVRARDVDGIHGDRSTS